MFEVLVQQMSDAGVLTEEDKRERRIQLDSEGKLSHESLTLHLTLMSSKWRSLAANRKMIEKIGKPKASPATRTRMTQNRSRRLVMDATKVVDPNYDFGSAVITQVQLCRRAMSSNGDFFHCEKAYKLA